MLTFGHGYFPGQYVEGTADEWSLSASFEPLQAFGDRMVPIRGLDIALVTNDDPFPNSHTAGSFALLTADATFEETGEWVPRGPSIEWVLGPELEPDAPWPNIPLGVRVRTAAGSRLTYADDGIPNAVVIDPSEAFDALFANVPDDQTVVDPAVLQTLAEDLAAIEDPLAVENEPETVDLHLRVLHRALQLRLAGAGIFQWRDHAPQANTPWLTPYPGDATGYHELIHQAYVDDPSRAAMVEVQAWLMGRYAAFIQALEDTPEGSGTMLDHTLVVIISEAGDQTASHGMTDLPVLLIGGGADDPLPQGVLVDVDGAHQGDLWVTLAEAMGVELTGFGAPQLASAPIDALLGG